MRKLIAVMTALPIAAFAQGMGPARDASPGRGPWGQGQGKPTPEQVQQMQKRARLALTLGLAVALDLDQAQALKLGDTVGRFADRRRAIHEQLRDAHETLRRAAHGEKVAPGDVDQAITKLLDGRQQVQAIDRELVGAVTKDLAPEKKARAVLFLEHFQRRFGRGGPGMHMGPGMMHGPGGGPGMHGRMGMMGAGPGPAMAGACPGPDCAGWDSDDD